MSDTIRQRAEDGFTRTEQQRLERWKFTRPWGHEIHRAVREVCDVQLDDLESPWTSALDVQHDWITTGAVGIFERDDSLRVFVRCGEPDGDDVAVDVYAIGSCPRCEADVPLAPALDGRNLAPVLRTGRPVGHDCPATWTP